MSRQQGVHSTLSFAPARLVRNFMLPLMLKVDWLSRRGMSLALGYNPREEPYFHIQID